MSDLLGIGASGIRAYQSALTTVSENIANASTAGYTRRSSTISEVSSTGGSITSRSVNDVNGSVITGIKRIGDMFRSADVRSAGADLARSEASIGWMDKIETTLSNNQLGDRLTSFFNAAKAIAADPTATTPRQAMLEAATSVAGAFSATGKGLNAIDQDIDATADDSVTTLNGLGASLARVNDAIARVQPGTAGAAQLGDQRDQLLEQMSAISDVAVTTDDLGRATVRLGAGGPVFVAGSDAGYVTYARGDAGAVSFALHRDGASSTMTPGGGVLAGVGESAQRVAAARDSLNTIATGFVDAVNTAQGMGRDLDGNAGSAMFAVRGSPTDIGLGLTDPRGIAAAAVGGGTRDNGNLANFEALRSSGKFEANTTALVSGNASALAARKSVAEAQSAIRDNAVAARDSVTGVNLDNEAVDLMRFQQAYQASARVVQVARETFQSILTIQ
ncbi:flagellar biosynthesis protein FlgK [Sphingomonas sp. Leaf357]|uniref:flagellar hook-associated protein FlgK n=1 Tax=Sphingomonas sp. Leaf357 TaxID=1736350 RepID=UPI0006F49098|nr:flagellar hook-associated protein FlgK [Sphingomonas sp. Leaf357]KQS03355.1 flagellar biosynthesis protein FlgK [Sphingomonas sp. Leaf357]